MKIWFRQIKFIEILKDEIEQFDVYQSRYNVNCDSHEQFVAYLNAYNEDLKQLSFNEEESCAKVIRS